MKEFNGNLSRASVISLDQVDEEAMHEEDGEDQLQVDMSILISNSSLNNSIN